jgi:hypothetical protein
MRDAGQGLLVLPSCHDAARFLKASHERLDNKNKFMKNALTTPLHRDIIQFMKCPICSKKFKPTREWQAYCSTKCGNKARYVKRYERVKAALAKHN